MHFIREWQNNVEQAPPSAVCIGVFDGVHLGHQELIKQTKDLASELNLCRAMLTFEPSPRYYFAKKQQQPLLPRLLRFRDKYQLLVQSGLEYLYSLRFNEAMASLSVDDFLQYILVDLINAKAVIVGDDFRFAANRQGGISELQAWGERNGCRVAVVQPVEDEFGQRISSTMLRAHLLTGDMARVAAILGRDYSVSGCVRPGDGRGRQIGVPTANVHIPTNALPIAGVFVVKVRMKDGVVLDGVANVGAQPTFAGEKKRLEIHLFDFAGDLYGHHVEVFLLHQIRGVEKFAGVAELVAQIQRDIAQAKQWLK